MAVKAALTEGAPRTASKLEGAPSVEGPEGAPELPEGPEGAPELPAALSPDNGPGGTTETEEG